MKHPYELVSRKLRERMEEKDLSVRELANCIQSSYENTRCIVHGRLPIPEPSARLICHCLDIQPEEFDRLRTLDELRHKTPPLTPSFTPMERFWASLSEEHRQDLVCLARRWAAQDRVAKRNGEIQIRPESRLAASG